MFWKSKSKNENYSVERHYQMLLQNTKESNNYNEFKKNGKILAKFVKNSKKCLL